MHVPANTVRIIIVVVAVAAVVIVMLVTGLADDKAPPGSGGQGARDPHGHRRLPLAVLATIPTRRSGPTQRFRLAAA
jgi:hypothetical protein